MGDAKPTTIDEYIGGLPDDQAAIIREVRAAVLRGAPEAEEKISYSMPSIVIPGRANLFYAAWKDHVGIYPVTDISDELATRIEPYHESKGTLKFKYADGIPYDLIERIARERTS